MIVEPVHLNGDTIARAQRRRQRCGDALARDVDEVRQTVRGQDASLDDIAHIQDRTQGCGVCSERGKLRFDQGDDVC